MMDVWDKFNKEMTTTATHHQQSDETAKLFPCFTIKYLSPYKKRGFYFDIQQFQENSLRLNEIFRNETIMKLKNSSLFNIKEINSFLHGKCYSLCPLTLLALNETISLYIKNKQNVEILMYKRGEDFWLSLLQFPFDVASAKIEAKNSDNLVSANLKVKFSPILIMSLTSTETFLDIKSISYQKMFCFFQHFNYWLM
jgi:hypothetical protein